MKGQATNGLILLAVVLVVGGVAWFRSGGPGADAVSVSKTSETSASPGGAGVVPVQKGELCPDQPNLTGAGEAAPAGARPGVKLPRVVDLGAGKCKACIELAPILEELRKEYAGRVTVEFVDVWVNPKAGDPYHIRIIPTQIFFDADGKEVWRHEGFLPKADFVAKFAELGVK
ncbi:MAG: thioredoxin family protein [Planctomycetota bacterium]